jgi:SAM-dependent methyltransferase
MKEPITDPASIFDAVAENYDEELKAGISLSGESKEFFAENRIKSLGQWLRAFSFQSRHVVDFGCGNGTATPFLRELPGVERITGLDVSGKAVAIAEQSYGNDRTHFELVDHFSEEGTVDLIYTNGVFHHIAPEDRPHTLSRLARMLRHGGIISFWENNPWNPGTRYVMARISFDRDAIPVSIVEAPRLLRTAGFQILRRDSAFFFPRPLAWFRGLEPMLSSLPFGAQYHVLGRKEI